MKKLVIKVVVKDTEQAVSALLTKKAQSRWYWWWGFVAPSSWRTQSKTLIEEGASYIVDLYNILIWD